MNERSNIPRPVVLFGYDGTEANQCALRWAVGEARLRELDLVMCHCWHWPYSEDYVDHDIEAIVQRAGDNLLEQGARQARDLGVPGEVCKRLMSGPVDGALLHESQCAELIVIGAHEPHRLPPGSTARQFPARSRRPVVVARGETSAQGLVVAGTDGSPGGEAALGFAFEEAALREWPLQIVYGCWEPGAVDESELALFSDRAELRRCRTELLERVIDPWRERYPKVDTHVSLRLEGPREALLDAAETATLLVVGARGSGTLDPLLLGATSSAMLHHAPCSVAIVPARDALSGALWTVGGAVGT